MNRTPQPLAEPALPQSRAGSGSRAVLYGMMAVLLVGGTWLRYGPGIEGGLRHTLGPLLGAPAAQHGADAAAQAHAVRGLIELGLVAQAEEAPAVQAMGLAAGDAQTLQQQIARRRVRLVQLPVFERDGGSGALVEVDANGLTRVVRLGTAPVTLTIPMNQVGSVSFRLVGDGQASVGIGAFTLNGPVGLPQLERGQTLEVGVIAE